MIRCQSSSYGHAVRFRDSPLLLRCGLPLLPCISVRRVRLTLPSHGTGELEASL